MTAFRHPGPAASPRPPDAPCEELWQSVDGSRQGWQASHEVGSGWFLRSLAPTFVVPPTTPEPPPPASLAPRPFPGPSKRTTDREAIAENAPALGLLILMFVAIWQFVGPESSRTEPVAFSQFMSLVRAKPEEKHVESVEIKDREYTFVVVECGAQDEADLQGDGPRR